ncbi:MAG: exodeoxyribonuclease V subunit gamma [Clostridiales bacterium]|nr:exodeoxyribonuclease V subunit gamma [Clostridiales bacterium]
MFQLILGRAGSGKTEFIRENIAVRAENGEDGIILIVPEQFSFETERFLIKRLGIKKARNIEVLSFTRLVDSFKREYGSSNGDIIDDTGRTVLMALAIEGVKDKLEIYKKNIKNISFINSMLSFSNEIKTNAISVDEFFHVSNKIEDKFLKDKIQEILLIMQAYDALVAQKFIDDKEELSRLAKSLEKHHFFEGRTVAIDAFKGFTGQEMKIIERIIEQSNEVMITLCTDDLSDKDNGLGVFSNVKKTGKQLKNMAKQANAKIAVPLKLEGGKRFLNEPLKELEKNIFNNDYSVYNENSENDIVVCECDDIQQECDYICAQIKRLMREEGVRARDIAVVFRDSAEISGSFNNSLKKYGVPFFQDSRQPVATQPLIALVRSALAVVKSSFDTNAILRYLKTGLTSISLENISTLENYAFMWNITGLSWLENFTQSPQGLSIKSEEKSEKELKEINEIRKKVIEPLKKFSYACKDATGKEIARAIYELIIEIKADENLKKLAVLLQENGEQSIALEQERIWDMLMEMLNQFAITMGESVIKVDEFASIFELAIANADLGVIPYALDEITVGSADRIRATNQKIVFVAGANEGIFPKTTSGDILFSNDERKMLNEKYDVAVSKNIEYLAVEEMFYAYSAICSAREKLFVTYSRKKASGESLYPSVIVDEIKKIIPQCKKENTLELSPEFFIESERSAFEVYSSFENENSLKSSIKKYLETNQSYAEKLKSIENLKKNADFEISDKEIARKLFKEKIYLSASKIENYYSCPFNFFCKYGINAMTREKAELNPRINGTVIHYVLENYIKDIGSKNLGSVSFEERITKIRELLEKYLEENMGGSKGKTEQFVYLYNNLLKTLDKLIENITIEFAESLFEARDFELSIAPNGQIKPYELELENGGSVIITGSVDRVDVMQVDDESFVRVVDYKSGGKTFELSDVLEGLKMQMLIYLFCIEENGKELYGEKIRPAAILYKPAGNYLINGTKQTDVKKELLKCYKMNGMALNDSRVQEGMGLYNAKPIVDDKKLVTLSQMGQIKKKVDSLIEKMGNNLHNGKIEAVSVECGYCDYKSVCGYEESKKLKEIKKMSFADSLEEIKKEFEADEH